MIGLLPRWRCAIVAAAVMLLAMAVSHGAAAQSVQYPIEVHLFADAREPGVVTLAFYGAKGTPVAFYERVGGRLQPLGTRTTPTGLATFMRHAVKWQCDRLVRRFLAITYMPDGRQASASYDVRTPSCATRLELDAPRRVGRDKVGRIRVVDRWGNGDLRARLCLTPPDGARRCHRLKLARAVAGVTHRFRPRQSGRWRIELRYSDHKVRRMTTVGDGRIRSKPTLKVLTTGDSTMQGLDSYLTDELGDDANVRSDVQPGTGLVKPGGPWETLAAGQTKAVQQDVTVISIGAADDFRLRAFDGMVHECCDAGWIAEYSGRVRQTMTTYLRKGRARVVWLTLPIPRGDRPFAAAAVNAAVLRAAIGLRGVTVVRMDTLFTPDGHRDVMPYRGANVRVFRTDGVHLTITGTAIASKLVAAAVRAR